jgi:hypothetical protein
MLYAAQCCMPRTPQWQQHVPQRRGLRISEARLRGREAERFGVYPAVMLGQDIAGLAGLVRNSTVADLTPYDRKM